MKDSLTMTTSQQNRDDIPVDVIVDDFLAHTDEEEPKLAKSLRALEDDGRRELAGVLGRFDVKRRGQLDARQRLFARRVLIRLRKPSASVLVHTNKILDYLDLNTNSIIEEDELELCVAILELFAKADSDNDTLSEIELEMLYAVLRHIDSDDSHRLESHEREELLVALKDPERLMAKQQMENPRLREILQQRGNH